MNDEVQRTLGRIEGKLDSLSEQQKKQDTHIKENGERIGKLEIKSATTGAVAGGIVGIGVSLLIAKIKSGIGL